MVQRILRRRLCWTWQPVTVSLFVACSSGWAQTTQPQPTTRPGALDFQTLLKQAPQRPLTKVELKHPDGQALSEAEQAEIARSEKLMADAATSRAQGDFATAHQLAAKAKEIRERLLGVDHFLTVSGRVLAASMEGWSGVPVDAQKKLVESDKRLASAKDLQDHGEYNAAAEAAQAAVSLREAVLPDDQAELGAALLRLGDIRIDLRQYDRADQVLNRAGQMLKTAYGMKHPETARLLDRIGWLRITQAAQDRTNLVAVDEAVKTFKGAVAIFVRTVGENAEMAESLDNLGTALVATGDMRKALGIKLRALIIRQKVLGPSDEQTGVSLSNIAWLYEGIHDDRQAILLREKALAVFKQSLGPDHPYSMIQRDSLARLYEKQGKREEAVRMLEAVVQTDAKRADKLAPGVGSRLVRLADAYLKVGRLDDALRLLHRAYQHAEALYSHDQRQPATQTMVGAARVCGRNRMFEEQLKFQQKAVDWDNTKRGQNDNVIIIQRASRLGGLYLDLGRLDDAKRILSEVVERFRKVTEKGDVRMASPLLNLAQVHEKLDNLDEAEKLCDEVLQISEAKLRRKLPGLAYAHMEMGRINILAGHLEMARFSLDESREIFKKYTKQDPNGTIKILRELAHYHIKKGEPRKALTLLREALQRCRDWAKKSKNVHSLAATTKTLKALLDATDANDPALKKERQAWQTEFQSLLEAAKADHALSGEEKAWLKELEQ